jgi:hypothetical protein
MSDPKFQFSDTQITYVMFQDGRRYFENEKILNFIEANYEPIKEIKVLGAVAVKIYKINNLNVTDLNQNLTENPSFNKQ